MLALVFAVIAYCRAFFIGRHRLGLEVSARRGQLAASAAPVWRRADYGDPSSKYLPRIYVIETDSKQRAPVEMAKWVA
jgi:hypothetical protein